MSHFLNELYFSVLHDSDELTLSLIKAKSPFSAIVFFNY